MNLEKKNEQHLLVVEDDEGLQRQLRWCLDDYNVVMVKNRNEALAAIRRYQPPVMTLDLGLPPDPENVSEGFATLQAVLDLDPNIKIIVITGNDEHESAIKSIAHGAYDFYQKPIDPAVLKIILARAYKLHALERENQLLQQVSAKSPLDGLITCDEKMLQICRNIEKVAPTDATTLLIGESGTGKEILANALHTLSTRCDNKFVAINCAAIPENLLESELFGHEKGAFTGASKQTLGKLELADQGTIFLDEIGDLPLSLQAKLLRFLQERTIERVGGRTQIHVDVRIISATHQDLSEMIKEKQFRQDLYYRLSEITINIPPLRDRKGDSVLLARLFLEKYSASLNRKIKGITQKGLDAIENYAWPGNVRELEGVMKRSLIMAESVNINEQDLNLENVEVLNTPLNLREVRENAEKTAIIRALNVSQDNISQSAELLGVSRPTLYDLMKKYGLK